MSSTSYKDPSGFIFVEDGIVYRRITEYGRNNYDYLVASGLYDVLVTNGLLVWHNEVDRNVIKPEKIDFVSYPYEWSFSMLKDAALLTLAVQKLSLRYGMVLKDASAYNIQFKSGRPIFIDTLSFERYFGVLPWVAYRQFCQHFLAPLALMSYKCVELSRLLSLDLDGVPLSLASSLLPVRSKFNFGIFLHVYMHSKNQRKMGKARGKFGKTSMNGLVNSLESTIEKLELRVGSTIWSNYYREEVEYDLDHKREMVERYLSGLEGSMVFDLGSNTGEFSRIASRKGYKVVSFDKDALCVEANYLVRDMNVLPLVMDLTNPSPSIGWENSERQSIFERGKAHVVLALALVHHLVFSNNLNFNMIANFFSKLGKYLIVEFVPKTDNKVQLMLENREDIFGWYNQENFETVLGEFYNIVQKDNIRNSDRILYLGKRKESDIQ